MDADITRAASIIREGGLVAFPTETVYGLGANAFDAAAVRRIFALKGRPATSPLIVHVDSVEMCRTVVAEWPDEADRLAGQYWPGPLTLVLTKQTQIPGDVTGGLPTVGVRMPAHPIALELIRAAGVPIAAPSANRFAQLSPTTAAHVREAFGDDLLILDGGPCEVGIESTVLSLVGGDPVLLRPGMIAFDKIRQNLTVLNTSEAHPAPGMHERHYSPRTRVVLVDDGRLPIEGSGFHLRLPDDPADCAAMLYSRLHEVDRDGWDWIAIDRPPDTPEWAAIRDRLTRAAAI